MFTSLLLPILSNVLLVIMDDIGSETSLRMDTLRAEPGFTEFVSAYSLPTCSPTRAAILTGRHGFRTGVGSAYRDLDDGQHLSFDETLLPEAIPEVFSMIVGKWHLGDSFPELPLFLDPVVQGFDVAAVTKHNVDDHFSYDLFVSYPWGGFTEHVEQYSTTRTTDDALLMANSTPPGVPWFLVVSYHAAHSPFQEPPEFMDDEVNYLAAVDFLDDEIGRLIAGVPPDTTVIVIGDNGTPSEFGGGKGEVSDDGCLVPLLVRDPSLSGAKNADLVQAVDLFPYIVSQYGGRFSAGGSQDGLPFGSRSTVYIEFFKPNDPPHDTRWERATSNQSFRLWRDELTGDEEFRDLSLGEVVVCPSTAPLQYKLLSAELESIK